VNVPSRVLRVALTGGIATGKSYCRKRFAALGAPVIDSDVLARTAVAPGSRGLEAVVQRFGRDLLRPDGSLDRPTLARLVFADDDARSDLEALIHPFVYRAIEDWFADQERDADRLGAARLVAIADVPLLYETGQAKRFDRVVVVACSPDVQRARLSSRNGLSSAEIDQRLRAQMPIQEKRARADHVIDTEGSFAETDRQVSDVWRTLQDQDPAR
jgi:dephospho-CoA kinase